MSTGALAEATQALLQDLKNLRDIHQCEGGYMNQSDRLFADLERRMCNLTRIVEPDFEEATRRAAEKVFAVPELAEQIFLSGLSTKDLLRLQQVSRTFRDTLMGSPKLLRALGLLGDPSAFWEPTIHSFLQAADFDEVHLEQGFGRGASGSGTHDDDDCSFKLCGNLYTPEAKRLGSRIRQLLICQPPIREITVKIYCCGAVTCVQKSTGVTIGDLFDENERLRECHVLFPMAIAEDHDDDGFVVPKITFEGPIKLRSDDPVVIAKESAGAPGQSKKENFVIKRRQSGGGRSWRGTLRLSAQRMKREKKS